MDYNRIIELIQNPEILTLSDQNSIEQELKKYPFTPAFHILQLRWEQLFSPEEIEKTTERISIYSTHRELLKKIIDQPFISRKKETLLPVIEPFEKEEEKQIAENSENKTEEIIQETKSTEFFEKEEEIEVERETITQSEEKPNQEDTTQENIKDKNEKQSYIDKLGLSHLFSGKIDWKKEKTENKEQKETHFQNSIENIEKNIQKLIKKEEDLQKLVESKVVLNIIPTEKTIEKGIIEEIEKTPAFLLLKKPEETNSGEIKDVEPVISENKPEEEKIEKKEEVFQKEEDPNEKAEGDLSLTTEKESEAETENIITPTEKLTFNQWILLSSQKKSVHYKKNEQTQEKQKDIIEKFIETNPKISTPKKEGKTKQENDLKKDEIKDLANLMTITLAKLYVEQGKYDTAITAFKILSLKYPEKSSYFASEIKKIKKIKNSK